MATTYPQQSLPQGRPAEAQHKTGHVPKTKHSNESSRGVLNSSASRHFFDDCLKAVERASGIPCEIVMGKVRNHQYVVTRHVLWKMLRNEGWSYKAIGTRVRADHTSIIHGVSMADSCEERQKLLQRAELALKDPNHPSLVLTEAQAREQREFAEIKRMVKQLAGLPPANDRVQIRSIALARWEVSRLNPATHIDHMVKVPMLGRETCNVFFFRAMVTSKGWYWKLAGWWVE